MDSTWLHVGNAVQLFVDSVLIEASQAVTRRWHKPSRAADPLIVADRPWERTLYFTYSNHIVLRDPVDGRIKCWYEDLGPLTGGHPWTNRLLYAESDDGVTFRKPELDVVEIDGRATNIVMGYVDGARPDDRNPWADVGVHSNGIVIDPHPPRPDERFRTIFSRATDGSQGRPGHEIQCAHSPDGVHWRPYAEPPTLGSSGHHLSDVSCLHYDYDARQFVQNTRHGLMSAAPLPGGTPNVAGWFAPYYPHRGDLMNKRRVYRTRSADFLHWTDPICVSCPDDEIDNLDEAHYGMQQFRVGGMHFATLGVFRHVDNEMEVRLLHGRDGIHFTPADRAAPFLAPRGEGSWDAHMVSLTSPPVTIGDEWRFYHGGANVHHDWWMSAGEGIDEPEARDPQGSVRFALGMATLRKEGFASLSAGRQREGYVMTRPLMSPGRRLEINARCRPGGSVRVAVLDRDNRPVDGCGLKEADAFAGDAARQVVTWRGGDEAGPAGRWRKVLFHLRDADLFAFRFASGDG